jgi:hypothetical protein
MVQVRTAEAMCVLTLGGPGTEQARVLFPRLGATIRLT